MRAHAFALACLWGFALLSCAGRDAPASKAMPAQSAVANSPAKAVRDVKAVLAPEQPGRWRTAPVNAPALDGVEVIFFLDGRHGWAADKNQLYRTANGGSDWERLRVALPPQSEIERVVFTTPSDGWLAAVSRAPDLSKYQENRVWLFQTSDGGSTWVRRHEEPSSYVDELRFGGRRVGWAAGMRYVGISPFRFSPFLLRTDDEGRSWVDVSAELERVAAKESGGDNEAVTGLVAEGEDAATVFTSKGKIYKTKDGGRSWQPSGGLEEPAQGCLCHVGVSEGGRLWAAGGAYSVEGVWGMTAAEEADGSWTRHRLGEVFFSGVLFLSGREVLAHGSIPADKTGRDRSRRDGAVLHSSDGGRTWSIVYRSPRIKVVQALAAPTSDTIWAGGDKGTILKLNLAP